jgi:hypothetical protein
MKRPAKTVEIKDAMTWWLTKKRVFVVGDYEISLLAINHDQGCVKILVKNMKSGEHEINEEPLSLDHESSYGTY